MAESVCCAVLCVHVHAHLRKKVRQFEVSPSFIFNYEKLDLLCICKDHSFPMHCVRTVDDHCMRIKKWGHSAQCLHANVNSLHTLNVNVQQGGILW